MLGEFLYLFDQSSVRHGMLNPGGFLWAGEKNAMRPAGDYNSA